MEAGGASENLSQSPVFILTASRSGSTLLRFILDSHPEMACPPETTFSVACAHLVRTWDMVENAGYPSRPVTEAPTPSAEALVATRETIDRLFRRYLARRGKSRWCDKSLDSYMHAELLAQIYPEAKFVCLYRHCMDVIASGVEVCPWGLSRHGFDPYVAQYAGNSVAAIGSYWLDCAQAVMAFEENHPDSCHRIRYEDLVTAPEETAAGMFFFLGARQVPGITRACFETEHEDNGPGDEKLWFTSEVTPASMGRGVSVPTAGLPTRLLGGINEVLTKLAYRTVDDQWNAAVGRTDPRADATADPLSVQGRDADGPDELVAAVRAISDQIMSRPDGELRDIGARWPALAGHTVRIVVQNADGEHDELHWCFPGSANGGGQPQGGDRRPAGAGGEPAATMIASPATWRSLLDGQTNMVTEITAGRLRSVSQRDKRIRSDEIHALAALLGLIRIPLVRPPDDSASAGGGRPSQHHPAA